MEISPVALFRSPFKSKFGIPKQSGLVDEIEGEIILLPEYSNPDFIRGIDGFDYLWLLWQFSYNSHAPASPLVRPPLLGGNEKMGVFATRSPFRPNAIGLSSVRLAGIEQSSSKSLVLKVRGADLQDGTPIFDIKPYIPYTDSHADARAGFVDDCPMRRLAVTLPDELACLFSPTEQAALCRSLALDPRPHYHADGKVYGMPFKNYDVKFRVDDGKCLVLGCELIG
ncbi:MAG: tRNA (N6-threonylcarbamoyladenosine(37)-N6)-methyltransferase TrmO [Prevotella sp.]|nr:tRNA (N6-threonylcarbamoyladenosine(37)-N6)-methyltransferase TrmO [Prevotella sp.]